MSMMKTLAKVAIGVAVAKGVSGMMKKSRSSGSGQASRQTQSAPQRQPGQGGLFGGAYSPGGDPQARSGGGLEDMLGSILGGGATQGKHAGQPRAQQGGGGLGGLLEQLSGRPSGGGARQGGGLNDLLGGLAGRADTPSGGGLGVSETKASAEPATRSFGDLFNEAVVTQEEPETDPTADQEALAALMLRAMIMAMKADGEIDRDEQQRLMDRLGDVSADEHAFVQGELRSPVDAKSIARDTPKGLESQVYAMSVLGIDLDHQDEAQYLHELAQAMGIGPEQVNAIHEQLGVPTIYT